MKRYQFRNMCCGIWLMIIIILTVSHAWAGELIVSWEANSESDLMGYKIYYGSSSGNYNKILDVGNVLNYSVTNLDEGKEYFFAVTAYDSFYNESGFSSEVSEVVTVTDFTPPVIYSFMISSNTEAYLTFSEAVEKTSAENMENYQINNGIAIQSAELDPNQRTVKLVTSQFQQGEYVITVNNVKDLAQNIIAANSSYNYNYQPADETAPTITNVNALDGTHILVSFSEEIKKTNAEQVGNYQINKNISVLQAKLEEGGSSVQLITSEHHSGETYILTINNICDCSPQQNYITPNTTKQYTYYEEDKISPSIYTLSIINETMIELTYTEKVEKTSAEQLSNYQIDNNITINSIKLKDNNVTVQINTSSHQSGVNYTLTVVNIKDCAQPANVNTTGCSTEYTYDPEDTAPPKLVIADAKDATHIDVIFDEVLDRTSAEEVNNYSINKEISVIEAMLDENQLVVHLVATTHQSGQEYTITVNNIKDKSPNSNIIIANSNVKYTYVSQDYTPPQIVEVKVEESNYLMVKFNEIIERESAENITNYMISDGMSVLNSSLDNSLNVVYLTTTEHQPNVTYSLTVNNIKDRSSNENVIAPNSKYNYFYEIVSLPLIADLSIEQYQISNLKVGDPYYTDRIYTINSIPDEMNGYYWIRTANDDRGNKDENFLSFTLNEPSKVYVAYDSRALNYPNWLVEKFYRIGQSIGVSEYAKKLDLWEMECEPGKITLGGNLATGAQGVESMYVVLIENNNPDSPERPDDMNDPLSMGPANMFLLYQNYPNPFNSGTEIRFQLPKDVYVELTVYNILGQTVKSLVQGYKNAAHHFIRWNGTNEDGALVPSGVYFSRLVVKRKETINQKVIDRIIYNDVRKMLMVK